MAALGAALPSTSVRALMLRGCGFGEHGVAALARPEHNPEQYKRVLEYLSRYGIR